MVDLKEDTRWKGWAAWSRCGYPCTSGSQTRSRQCAPYSKPKYGGTNHCIGSDTESRDCASNTSPSNEILSQDDVNVTSSNFKLKYVMIIQKFSSVILYTLEILLQHAETMLVVLKSGALGQIADVINLLWEAQEHGVLQEQNAKMIGHHGRPTRCK